MRIIIDFSPLFQGFILPEAALFIINSLNLLVQDHRENEWFFLVDQHNGGKPWHNVNAQVILAKKKLPGRVGWKAWFDWQVPALLKKHQAHLFISTGGVSSVASTPQCIWVPGITKMHGLQHKSYSSFYEKRIKKSIASAGSVFVFSEENKQEVLQQYGPAEDKLMVIDAAPGDPGYPLLWTEKENVKIRYAGGKEYFVVTGSPGLQNMINVLKAFSEFKKRQQSNMQLVISVEAMGRDIDFIEKLESYKYRSDVYLPDHLAEGDMLKMMSAAYALIYCAEEGDPGTNILNAFQAGVPVIVNPGACPKRISGDAALYADMDSPGSLSSQLMLVYKDETLRNACIEKGKMHAQLFSKESTTNQLWNGILQAANN